MRQAEKTLGRRLLPDTLEPPVGSGPILRVFNILSATRTAGLGPNPISLRDIEAFQRVFRERLEPWEVELIIAMDQAMMEASWTSRNST